jgi:hypothetical protein
MMHTHCSGEEMVTHKLGKYPGANTHGAEPAEDEHSQARNAHGLETQRLSKLKQLGATCTDPEWHHAQTYKQKKTARTKENGERESTWCWSASTCREGNRT